MSRIWTVVLVNNSTDVRVEEHVTQMENADECYKVISETVGPSNRVIAMIPGNHVSGSKVYPIAGADRRFARDSHIDPFDTPTDF